MVCIVAPAAAWCSFRRLSTAASNTLSAVAALPLPPCRLLFWAVAAVNLLQCLLGLRFFHAIYPAGSGATARAPACMLAAVSCGAVWLIFYGHMSVLPFRCGGCRWSVPDGLARRAASVGRHRRGSAGNQAARMWGASQPARPLSEGQPAASHAASPLLPGTSGRSCAWPQP